MHRLKNDQDGVIPEVVESLAKIWKVESRNIDSLKKAVVKTAINKIDFRFFIEEADIRIFLVLEEMIAGKYHFICRSVICREGIGLPTTFFDSLNGISVNIYICALEGIDGLLWITYYNDFVFIISHENAFEDVPLFLVCILKFIYYGNFIFAP